MELILASNSPRRKELLTKGGYVFSIIKSDFEELLLTNDPITTAVSFAKGKANDVYLHLEDKIDKIVLGADTVVCLDGEILGKPKDKTDAIRMLSMLSGKTHKVVTGFCVILNDKIVTDYDVTDVTFNKLTKEKINEYISSGLYVGKAGSYGIQDGFNLVEKISGSLNNVIGLPTEKVFSLLDKLIK